MPAVTFLEPGTDATQDLTFWGSGVVNQGGTGSIASASDQFNTGLRSIKCINAAGGDSAMVATADGVCADAGTAISFAVRFSTAAPSVATCFMAVGTNQATGDEIFGLALNTNGTLAFGGRGTTTKPNGSTVLLSNKWYRLTLSYVITSLSSWSAKLYINGVQELSRTQVTDGNLTEDNTQELWLGTDETSIVGSGSTGILTVWYDDVYVDNRTDLSDPGTTAGLSVTAKRPFANGTTNGFTTNGSGSGYGSGHAPFINGNYPLSSDTTVFLSVAVTATTEEFNIEGASVGDASTVGATLVGVRGWISATSTLTETDHIVVDGTSTAISVTNSAAPGTIFTQNSATPTVYPAGTGSDIGLTTTALATTKLFAAGVLVAYIPAPPTSALAAAGVGATSLIGAATANATPGSDIGGLGAATFTSSSAGPVVDPPRGDTRPFPFLPGSPPSPRLI